MAEEEKVDWKHVLKGERIFADAEKSFKNLGKAFAELGKRPAGTRRYYDMDRLKVHGSYGPAYLPFNDGFYKIENCIVKEVQHEHYRDHCHTLRGDSFYVDRGSSEITITLRCFGNMEEVELPEWNVKVSSLDTYSNLELLEELEKRTSNRDLISS